MLSLVNATIGSRSSSETKSWPHPTWLVTVPLHYNNFHAICGTNNCLLSFPAVVSPVEIPKIRDMFHHMFVFHLSTLTIYSMEEQNAQYKKEKVCLVRKDKKEVMVACLLERRGTSRSGIGREILPMESNLTLQLQRRHYYGICSGFPFD